MKPRSPSTEARHRKEIASLRKANHTLTIERQGYALRAKVAECALADLRFEIAKLTVRFDLLFGHPVATVKGEA